MGYRTIVTEHRVTEIIDAESAIHPRLAEAFDGLEWRLSRTPEAGYRLDDRHYIYRQDGDPKMKYPGLLVLYTFTLDQVHILAVQVQVVGWQGPTLLKEIL